MKLYKDIDTEINPSIDFLNGCLQSKTFFGTPDADDLIPKIYDSVWRTYMGMGHSLYIFGNKLNGVMIDMIYRTTHGNPSQIKDKLQDACVVMLDSEMGGISLWR
jgi:hypothetical protein